MKDEGRKEGLWISKEFHPMGPGYTERSETAQSVFHMTFEIFVDKVRF
jgi:hypothetical protein